MRTLLEHSSPSMVCCFSRSHLGVLGSAVLLLLFLDVFTAPFLFSILSHSFFFYADNFLCFTSPKTPSSGWIKHLSKLWMFHGFTVLSSSLVDYSSSTCLRTYSFCALLYRKIYISQCKINIPAVSLLLFPCLLFI
uniref:Tropomyosin 1 (Alpha) n=1 Tax=Hypotaenidia okinawae TaxID=2861861 RepID=A0A6G1RFC0_9GRUI